MSKPKTIGLALSGGGARGVTHIGVLQALEELGIKPTHISGTSAGALIGGMYAAGLKPLDILEIIRRQKFFSPANFALKGKGFFHTRPLQQMLERNLPISTFEALPVKLYVTATSLEDGVSKIFDSGDMVFPMVASCAVPLMFSPVIIDGKHWVDGGIINNFPVEPIAACDLIIGSNVSTWPENHRQWSRMQIIQRSFHLSMSHYMNEKTALCHVFINPPVGHYNGFGKAKLQELVDVGYNYTMMQRARIIELGKV